MTTAQPLLPMPQQRRAGPPVDPASAPTTMPLLTVAVGSNGLAPLREVHR